MFVSVYTVQNYNIRSPRRFFWAFYHLIFRKKWAHLNNPCFNSFVLGTWCRSTWRTTAGILSRPAQRVLPAQTSSCKKCSYSFWFVKRNYKNFEISKYLYPIKNEKTIVLTVRLSIIFGGRFFHISSVRVKIWFSE